MRWREEGGWRQEYQDEGLLHSSIEVFTLVPTRPESRQIKEMNSREMFQEELPLLSNQVNLRVKIMKVHL